MRFLPTALAIVVFTTGCGYNKARLSASATLDVLKNYSSEIQEIENRDSEFSRGVSKVYADHLETLFLSAASRSADTRSRQYADELIYRQATLERAPLSTVIGEGAAERLSFYRESINFAEKARTEVTSRITKNELQVKDIELVKGKLAYLASEDPVVDQVLFYLNFAAATEREVAGS